MEKFSILGFVILVVFISIFIFILNAVVWLFVFNRTKNKKDTYDIHLSLLLIQIYFLVQSIWNHYQTAIMGYITGIAIWIICAILYYKDVKKLKRENNIS